MKQADDPPMAANLPATTYYEFESKSADAKYAIWVTLPPRYESEPDAQYPVIFLTDGNSSVATAAPHMWLLRDDPINPIKPFILVSIGYIGSDATNALAVRARDLLPPGEPQVEGNEGGMKEAADVGLISHELADLYLHHLRNPKGDRFLAFIVEELFPAVKELYRVDENNVGLFGYSYGGLFATYAALSRTGLIKTVGAGSPGILPEGSRIWDLYGARLQGGDDFEGYSLHMTVCELELTAPSYYQPLVGAGTYKFFETARQQPLPGLSFSTHIIPHESHATGHAPSWYSFLRTCYSAK